MNENISKTLKTESNKLLVNKQFILLFVRQNPLKEDLPLTEYVPSVDL